MEKVYHYTSIENLKLILQNNTIRFTRFDLMDDQTETEGLPNMLKKSYLLSCWVTEEKEQIPQWVMYARKGVRIELPIRWYKKHPIPVAGRDQFIEKMPLSESHPLKDMFFPLPVSQWFSNGQKFNLMPPVNEEDGFMLRVEYSENFTQLKRQHWEENENGDGINLSPQSGPVKYKDMYWSFQKEFRYYLLCSCKYADQNHIPRYIDIPIDEKALRQIKIRVYPNCSAADWNNVSAIFSDRFPLLETSQHLERSQLDGKYHSKQ